MQVWHLRKSPVAFAQPDPRPMATGRVVRANKNQIRAAVQELFNVRVEAVRTMNRKGKTRRFRQTEGKLPDWKKAVVTLHADDKIEFF